MRHLVGIVTALAFALGLVAPAQATPPDHLGLDQLRALLAANPNGVPGYFLTVPGGPSLAQQSPVQVDMTVKAVAEGQGPDGALILLEADMTDPVMQDVGGIAAGMSGSPLYIDGGTGYAMIGALSYGDIFTLNGLGLATPIDYMLTTQTEWPATNSVLHLDHPVQTESGTVSTIRVAKPGEQAPTARGTVSMSPLIAMRVSGIPAHSAVQARFETLADKYGLPLLAATSGDCTTSGYGAAYENGGSLGTYLGLGAVDFGGYGTVTYVDGTTAMGFGHSLLHMGQTDLFATNVWIDGIWGSSFEPYKLGCPGKINGALTQDRSAAVGVAIPGVTATTPVTADATVTTNKTRTATARTSVAAGTFATEFAAPLVAAAAAEPIYRLANQATMAGTARTLTTISVADGTTTRTLTRSNLWSSSDVLGESSNDPYLITAMLYSVPGIVPTVNSVDMRSEVDQSVNSATITSARGGPLQPGPNSLVVRIKPTGRAAVQVPVSVDIPANAVLDAGLTVSGGYDFGSADDAPTLEQPDSFDALVDMIEDVPTNDEIVVQAIDADGNAITVGSAVTDYVVSGSVFPTTVAGMLIADVTEVPLGSPVNLMATLPGIANGQEVSFEAQTGGGAWTPIATVPITTSVDGMTGAFVEDTPTANTVYRASWPGNDTTLAWSATTPVSVIPPVGIEGSRKGRGWALTLSSDPVAAGTGVVAQAKVNGSWSDVATGTLGADGTTRLRWSPASPKVKVRAVTRASARFASSRSEPVVLSTVQAFIDTGVTPRDAGNVVLGLRHDDGSAITGVKYRIQRQRKSGWETVDASTLRRRTRVWLSNGDYRLMVPAGKKLQAAVRERFTVDAAAIMITKAAGGRGSARVEALAPMPLRFTVQSQMAGQWRDVGGWHRLAPPRSRWSGSLRPGRYRVSFPDQGGFNGVTSRPFRVR